MKLQYLIALFLTSVFGLLPFTISTQTNIEGEINYPTLDEDWRTIPGKDFGHCPNSFRRYIQLKRLRLRETRINCDDEMIISKFTSYLDEKMHAF